MNKKSYKKLDEKYLNNWTCECCDEAPATYSHNAILVHEEGYYEEKQFVEQRFLCDDCYNKLPNHRRKTTSTKCGGARPGAGRKKLPVELKGKECRYYLPPVLKPVVDKFIKTLKARFKETGKIG